MPEVTKMYKIETKKQMVVGDRFSVVRVSKFRCMQSITFQVLAAGQKQQGHPTVYSVVVVS